MSSSEETTTPPFAYQKNQRKKRVASQKKTATSISTNETSPPQPSRNGQGKIKLRASTRKPLTKPSGKSPPKSRTSTRKPATKSCAKIPRNLAQRKTLVESDDYDDELLVNTIKKKRTSQAITSGKCFVINLFNLLLCYLTSLLNNNLII